MRHGMYMNASRHVYECVTSRIWCNWCIVLGVPMTHCLDTRVAITQNAVSWYTCVNAFLSLSWYVYVNDTLFWVCHWRILSWYESQWRIILVLGMSTTHCQDTPKSMTYSASSWNTCMSMTHCFGYVIDALSRHTSVNDLHCFLLKYVCECLSLTLWSKETPPPRGGFLFPMFNHQEPCVRKPPSKNLVQILRGGSSYTRFLVREHSK